MVFCVIFTAFFFVCPSLTCSHSAPLNCSDAGRLCTSFLAFKPADSQTSADIQSMFDVLPDDITVEGAGGHYCFIRKNCSCSSSDGRYLTNTTFTVKRDEGSLYRVIVDAYGGLAFFPNSTRQAHDGAIVSLHLLCRCSGGLWNYLVSYVMQEGDTIASLASRFGVSMDSIETVNRIVDPSNVTSGAVYYVPVNSVPGEPYAIGKRMSPSPVPSHVPDITLPEFQGHHSSHLPYGWIMGSMGIVLFLVFMVALIYVLYKTWRHSKLLPTDQKDPAGHKFHILTKAKFFYESRRYFCCSREDSRSNPVNDTHHEMDSHIPRVIVTDALNMEKPVTFSYEEILASTDGFSDLNSLGHGTYGFVYHGILRGQAVTIKRMTATKTKEFMTELKLLCSVHHKNLVELIGYAASQNELFLIYEFAQKGSLKSHLHDPQSKGYTYLSWIARVQIALDAARGLEYIHEHTKANYVHRDVKSSNILLDDALRAKISDFGLAKLIGKGSNGETSTTKVVGTFGYLAPEYMRDGVVTSKSDVYAFAVVLFEIITGKEAITRTSSKAFGNPEKRSLVSVMIEVLNNSTSQMTMDNLKEWIDPSLEDLYPYDCAVKMALLARQCVEEDPILRPDMKGIVISLSQILLSSIEWEATLAGNSQIFSGLVQGR